jgi:hypothetical protein
MDYPITQHEYDRIRRLLYEETKISLGDNKQFFRGDAGACRGCR